MLYEDALLLHYFTSTSNTFF